MRIRRDAIPHAGPDGRWPDGQHGDHRPIAARRKGEGKPASPEREADLHPVTLSRGLSSGFLR
jgi:hypothetical protein